MMRTNNLIFVLLMVYLFFFTGCAEVTVARIERSNIDIAWPRPPLKAKIKFIGSISRIQETGLSEEKGFLAKSWEKITGMDIEDYRFLAPYGVSVDEDGTLYVVDRDKAEIVVINIDTGITSVFSAFPDDRSGFSEESDYPLGIAVAENLYVTYPKSGKVRVFSREGLFKKEFGEASGLERPTGVAVNIQEDRLYIVDTTKHNIKVFNLKGDFISSFGKRGMKEGEFNYPTHIFAGNDGTIYITDEMNFRVQTLSKTGEFLSTVGEVGQVLGTFQSPKGVATDSNGNIYVADAMADHIQVFNKQGALLIAFGENGYGYGQFGGPAGMFIDKKDQLYIADLYNQRIQIFKYVGSQ